MYAWLSAASLFSTKMCKQKEIWGLMVYHPNLSIEEVARICVPALVVTGKNDLVSQYHNDKLGRAIAGSQRMIVPDGDHFWMISKPKLLIQMVEEFLQ
jgi:pimeloyl-ACP methyl ester carboxylesterase